MPKKCTSSATLPSASSIVRNRVSTAAFASSASDGREISTSDGAAGLAVAASTLRTAFTWSWSART